MKDRGPSPNSSIAHFAIVNVSDAVSDWPFQLAVTVAVACPAQVVRTNHVQVSLPEASAVAPWSPLAVEPSQ